MVYTKVLHSTKPTILSDRDAFKSRKGRYEAPSLFEDLVDSGHRHDRKNIVTSLSRRGLRAKSVKKFKATTNFNHDLHVAPDLLSQDCSETAPNQKYIIDITSLWPDEG